MCSNDHLGVTTRQRMKNRGGQDLRQTVKMNDHVASGLEQSAQGAVGAAVEIPIEHVCEADAVAQGALAQRLDLDARKSRANACAVVADQNGTFEPCLNACLYALERNLGRTAPSH
ncbi:hypothetical protein [Ensifer sp. Root127]|uniref:hypothetical protein n=1 Tax=Ensifer sp. NM-2 TaxID=2109730 RepID=UPI000708D7DC|nr:hypothetical protein ASD03_36520 [Ensifer sp. Root127]